MAKLGALTISSASGMLYEFRAYSWDSVFKAMGVVYVITKRVANRGGRASHTYIYVGETADLSERFDNHPKLDCFKRHNANCICVHADANQASRLRKQAAILRAYTFPCND